MDSYDKRLIDANNVKEFKKELDKIEKVKKVERFLIVIDKAIRKNQPCLLILKKDTVPWERRKDSYSSEYVKELEEQVNILKDFGYSVEEISWNRAVVDKDLKEILQSKYSDIFEDYTNTPDYNIKLWKISWKLK